MTDALQQKIHIELLDLLDDVKFELTELNAQKGYTLTDQQISYLSVAYIWLMFKDKKQAIDNIMTIVEQQLEDQHFLEHYDKFQMRLLIAIMIKQLTLQNLVIFHVNSIIFRSVLSN